MTPTFSPRHRVTLAFTAAVGLLGGLAVLLGHAELGLLALLALGVLGSVLLLDVRRRQQHAGRALARLESQVGALGEQLRAELETLGAATRRDAEATRDRVAEVAASSAAADATTHELLRRLDYEPIAEVQALLQLLAKVPGAPPLPPVGGWALTAASLLEVWHLVETHRPRTIVECGSGTSTLWLAYAARHIGGARVVALDHDARFAAATRALLERHGLGEFAEVRHAPLREVRVGEEVLSWYDTEQLTDVASVELLLVDGPPKWTGAQARYPALPVLRDRLAPGALILADDAQRPEERRTIRRWRAEYHVGSPERLSRDLVLLRSE